MKIAIAGKGGTGKTTVTTLLATYLSRNHKVLAVDADSNENLALALGFPSKQVVNMKKLRHFLDEIYTQTKTDPNWETRHVMPATDAYRYHFGKDKTDLLIQNTALQRNNLAVMHLGTVDEEKRGIQSMCGSFGLLRVFLNHLIEDEDSYVLADLTAGNELLTRAAVINMDEVLLVVEPTVKNLSVAKDILVSLRKLNFNNFFVLVNKSFNEEDVTYVNSELNIAPQNIRRIPFSTEVIEIDNKTELSFTTAPKEIQKPISEMVGLLKKQPIDKNKLEKRAKELDKRLFPKEESVLTEEVHI